MSETLTDGLAETLAVFGDVGGSHEPLTTAEVTEQLAVSRRSTYARLERLVDREYLRSKTVGSRGRVWWRPAADGDDSGRSRGDERTLRRQREQIAALNNLNAVVREITDAVIEQSTREEIERVVCQRLVETDSYAFAWIGEVGAATQTVDVRAESGAEGYLSAATITVDPDDERSEGPTGRALRTGEVQTIQDIQTNPRYEPWRDIAAEYGFRSSAAVPVSHAGTTYGALNVYADRPDAFEGRERSVLGQLGEVVGHAIAAVERKRALMGDELVEVEFQIPDVFDTVDAAGGTEGQIALDETVPIRDDDYLVYGHVDDGAVDGLLALADALDHCRDAMVREGDAGAEFELRLVEPPVLSMVASLGGSVEAAVVEDGDYQLTLQLPPTVDVRRVSERVESAYPTAELLTRRQVTRAVDTVERTDRVLSESLTDRQRAALLAAYHAGFFEWPREASGEDVAESLGVSAPTFHQHLRKAERKVLDSLLSRVG